MSSTSASVWTRTSGTPVKMGVLEQTEYFSKFTYHKDFIDLNIAGLSQMLKPRMILDNTFSFKKRTNFYFIPQIQSLIPPSIEHNFQRQLTLKYLQQKDIDIPNQQYEQDWLILTTTGHGGIGHIDVFKHDEAALAWYEARTQQTLHTLDHQFGFSLKEFMAWYEINNTTEHLLQLLGPTPTAGGAIPKLLMSIAKSGFDHRLGLPSQLKQDEIKDVLIKLEKNTAYPGMIELEDFSLNMAKLAGFDAMDHFISQINDIPIIGIERFDRDADKNPIPTESIYSLMALADSSITHNHSSQFERIVDLINSAKADIFYHKKEARKHLFKRLIFSFLTGNGDLHMENLSIITQNHKTQFTPVYDPTPMRAYPLHNILSPMPFGAYGEHTGQYKIADALMRFAKKCALDKNDVRGIYNELETMENHFETQLLALNSLPHENKERLLGIHQKIKRELASSIRKSGLSP